MTTFFAKIMRGSCAVCCSSYSSFNPTRHLKAAKLVFKRKSLNLMVKSASNLRSSYRENCARTYSCIYMDKSEEEYLQHLKCKRFT